MIEKSINVKFYSADICQHATKGELTITAAHGISTVESLMDYLEIADEQRRGLQVYLNGKRVRILQDALPTTGMFQIVLVRAISGG